MGLGNTTKQPTVANSPLDRNMAEAAARAGSADNPVTGIAVDDNGNVKLTYADGTTDTISFRPVISEAINISGRNSGTVQDGTDYAPYKTIAAGLSTASYGIVSIWPGTYAENLSISPNHLTITTRGDEGSYRVEIGGNVTITSPVSSSISNLEIDGDLTINMTARDGDTPASLLYFNNIAVKGNVIISGSAGYVQFDQSCEFMKSVEISGGVSARLLNSQFEGNDSILEIDTSGTIELFNMLYVTMRKTNGTVIAAGGTIFRLRTVGSAIAGVTCLSGGTGSFIAFDALCMDETLSRPSHILIADGHVFSPCNFVYESSSSLLAGEIVPINGRGTSVLVPDRFVDGDFSQITWGDLGALLTNTVLDNVPLLSSPDKWLVSPLFISGSELTTIICQYTYQEKTPNGIVEWVVRLSSSGAGVARSVNKIFIAPNSVYQDLTAGDLTFNCGGVVIRLNLPGAAGTNAKAFYSAETSGITASIKRLSFVGSGPEFWNIDNTVISTTESDDIDKDIYTNGTENWSCRIVVGQSQWLIEGYICNGKDAYFTSTQVV